MKKGGSDAGLFWFIFIVGGGLYLLMAVPVVFFLAVVPLAILVIAKLIKWFKG